MWWKPEYPGENHRKYSVSNPSPSSQSNQNEFGPFFQLLFWRVTFGRSCGLFLEWSFAKLSPRRRNHMIHNCCSTVHVRIVHKFAGFLHQMFKALRCFLVTNSSQSGVSRFRWDVFSVKQSFHQILQFFSLEGKLSIFYLRVFRGRCDERKGYFYSDAKRKTT